MSLKLFAHPFSSYCQKVLIALYEGAIPFDYLELGPERPVVCEELARLWPLGKFPIIDHEGHVIVEATIIIEYLGLHFPSSPALVPRDPHHALETRMLDRIFDNYVMSPMQKFGDDALRDPGERDPRGVEQARNTLKTAYAWLDTYLAGREWAVEAGFTLADCAAAPALFYADWVEPIAAEHSNLRAYRARLLARPSIARVVDEARPYRHLFPLGAPNRD